MHADFPAFDAQWRLQGYGLEVLHCHFLCHCDDVAQLVGFAHGIVEDGRDDAAMAVARRSGEALGQSEVADEGAAFLVERELQLHSLRIVGAADEAVVLGEFDVARFVAVDLAGHGEILARKQIHHRLKGLDSPHRRIMGFPPKKCQFSYTSCRPNLVFQREIMNPTTVSVVVAIALFVGMLLCLDLGYRLGRRAQHEASWHEGVGALEAAVYALLGLLLGFTFSGATSRFEAHRQLSVKEANAISTAYLRLDELPQDRQPEMRGLFRDYLGARLKVQASLPDLVAAERAVAQSIRLQQQIWSRAIVATRADPTQSAARLLLPAINNMIDVTAERAVALQTHLPALIFYLLIFIALMSALLAGYGMAKRRKRSLLHMVLYAGCISATIYTVTDLEHPRSGLIRVDSADRALLQLRDLIQ